MPDEEAIFLDERGANRHTNPKHGWDPRGVRPTITIQNRRGANLRGVVAICADGHVVAWAFDQAVDGVKLQSFFENDLFPEIETGNRRLGC